MTSDSQTATFTREQLIDQCRKWLAVADTQDMKEFISALIRELER